MKIAIIGTGNVGSTLGRQWARAGHDVTFGTRDPDGSKVKQLLEGAGGKARAARAPDAARGADVIVLATPWDAARKTIEALGDLRGKVLVDCTNPLAPDLAGLAIGHSTSAGEEVARWAPGALVVKAFNSTGSGNMADPDFGGQAATMFICGDDARAKSTVAELAMELGFDVIDAGALRISRYLEPLAMLWITLAYAQGLGPEIAFKLLRRG